MAEQDLRIRGSRRQGRQMASEGLHQHQKVQLQVHLLEINLLVVGKILVSQEKEQVENIILHNL